MTLEIKRFDLSALRPFSSILILSSKTELLCDIIKTINLPCTVFTDTDRPVYRGLENCTVYMPVGTRPGTYASFYDRFNPEDLHKPIATAGQDEIVIYDNDILLKTRLSDERDVRETFYNGRHFRKWVIWVTSQPNTIGPSIRLTFAYIFSGIPYKAEECWRRFTGGFPTYEIFRDLSYAIIVDRPGGVMVIDNRSMSGSIEETVYWY